MESDQKYQIQLTEKALYQYNQILQMESARKPAQPVQPP